MSFITRFKIEFYCRLPAVEKCLEKSLMNIKTTHPISLTSFSNFLSFNSRRVFIFFVFCILSNKLNSISCGICLSFKSSHFELFCKIIIKLSSTGIFLGLWSRGPPCNLTSNPGEKSKQLSFWSFCLVSSNGWSMLYLASSKSRTHCSIALKFSAVQLTWMLIKTVSAFFCSYM